MRVQGSSRFLTKSAVIAVTALLAAVLLACSSDSSSTDGSSTAETATTSPGGGRTSGPDTPAPRPLPQRETVTVVVSSNLEAWAPLLLAQHFGEFEEENLEVVIQTAPPPDALVLVAQGTVDVMFTAFPVGQFNLVAEGTDLKGIANAHQSEPPQSGFYIQKSLVGPDGEPDIDKVRGATVAAIGGGGWASIAMYSLYQWLDDVGLTIEDFPEPITAPTPSEALQGLENGQMDIALLSTPVWQNIGPDSCCVLIEGTGGISFSQILVNGAFLEDQPEAAEAFVRAMMRTNRTYLQGDYHSDPQVMAALSEILQQPVDRLAAAPSLVFDPDMGFKSDLVQGIQDMYRDAGALSYEENLTLDQLADTSVVERVLQQ